MSRIDGVSAYVMRVYRDREAAKTSLVANITKLASFGGLGEADLMRDILLDLNRVVHRSEDLGSMRRLLGDLKHDAQKGPGKL